MPVVLRVWFGPVVLPWLAAQAVIGHRPAGNGQLPRALRPASAEAVERPLREMSRSTAGTAGHLGGQPVAVPPAAAFRPPRTPPAGIRRCAPGPRAPQLPAGYGTMVLLALVPPLWRRVMDPRVLAHYDNDIRRCGPDPGRARSAGSPVSPGALGETRTHCTGFESVSSANLGYEGARATNHHR